MSSMKGVNPDYSYSEEFMSDTIKTGFYKVMEDYVDTLVEKGYNIHLVSSELHSEVSSVIAMKILKTRLEYHEVLKNEN